MPGTYIVTLVQGVDAAKLAQRLKLKPTFVYGKAINGFAAPLDTLQLDIVRANPGVKAVEQDVKVMAPPRPVTVPGTRAPSKSWGLDRIDQREWDKANGQGDGQFTPQGNGAGVTAYILDTGIDYAHDEFGGRATFGFDAVADGRQGKDCNGHGTHVAGTVAGKTYGVARKADLVSVRVLDCEGRGSYSGMIAGFDWVLKNARQPAVLNGSLGGDRSVTLNNAATALSDAGVLPVVAAGNDSKDACQVSPASADRVYTVGASNRWDEETSFSNYGTCLEIYAPGEDIVSAKLGGGAVSLNGTSMASPMPPGSPRSTSRPTRPHRPRKSPGSSPPSPPRTPWAPSARAVPTSCSSPAACSPLLHRRPDGLAVPLDGRDVGVRPQRGQLPPVQVGGEAAHRAAVHVPGLRDPGFAHHPLGIGAGGEDDEVRRALPGFLNGVVGVVGVRGGRQSDGNGEQEGGCQYGTQDHKRTTHGELHGVKGERLPPLLRSPGPAP